MSGAKSKLIMVYEPEEACRVRLTREGFPETHALEISSYLAQSTDLAPEFGAIADACAKHGIDFDPVKLDDAAVQLVGQDPSATLIWTLTDGISYFRGSAAPTLARLNGLATIGAEDALFSVCQDKFRSGAVLSALGLPVPAAGLARNDKWLVEPPPSPTGYFVKPNRLGAKIGIWPNSHCQSLDQALDLSHRIYAAYRDLAVAQPYVPGRNVRASFLAVNSGAGPEALGIFFVESGGDFQTMADSLALYGETGSQAALHMRYIEPELTAVAATQPAAAQAIRKSASTMMAALGLRDVFSADFRVESDDTVHLIEFEVCPGLPCFDFRAYCRSEWNLGLSEAIAATAAGRFRRMKG